jgi:hypothetical protein
MIHSRPTVTEVKPNIFKVVEGRLSPTYWDIAAGIMSSEIDFPAGNKTCILEAGYEDRIEHLLFISQ